MSVKTRDDLLGHGLASFGPDPDPAILLPKSKVQRVQTVTHEAMDVKEESTLGESLSKHKYIILAIGLLLGVAAYAAVHYHLLGHLKWFGVTAGATFLACGILGLWIAHKPKNPNENRFANQLDHFDPQPEQQETALSRSKKALISFVVLSVLFGMTVLAFKFIPQTHVFDPNMGIGLAGACVGLSFAMIASYIYYQHQEKEDYEFQKKVPTTPPSALSEEDFNRNLRSHVFPNHGFEWWEPNRNPVKWRRDFKSNPTAKARLKKGLRVVQSVIKLQKGAKNKWVVHVPTDSGQLVPVKAPTPLPNLIHD